MKPVLVMVIFFIFGACQMLDANQTAEQIVITNKTGEKIWVHLLREFPSVAICPAELIDPAKISFRPVGIGSYIAVDPSEITRYESGSTLRVWVYAVRTVVVDERSEKEKAALVLSKEVTSDALARNNGRIDISALRW